MKLYAKIENGLPETVKKLIEAEIQNNEGKEISIEIKTTGGDKIRLYGFLYGCVYPIAKIYIQNTTGEAISLQDIDTMFKLRFYYEEVPDRITGELHKIPNRKRDMSKKELSEYTENVLNFMAENFGASFPEQEETQKFALINL